MLTISAKELRQNLSEYLKRAMRGEEIEIIYRSKPAIKLSPLSPDPDQPAKGSPSAFRAAMTALEPLLASHTSTLDPTRSIKQLYHEQLDASPKYSPRP